MKMILPSARLIEKTYSNQTIVTNFLQAISEDKLEKWYEKHFSKPITGTGDLVRILRIIWPSLIASQMVEKATDPVPIKQRVVRTNSSKTRGIEFRHNKWKPRISYGGKKYSLGSYETLDDAIAMRDKAQEAKENNTFLAFYTEL